MIVQGAVSVTSTPVATVPEKATSVGISSVATATSAEVVMSAKVGVPAVNFSHGDHFIAGANKDAGKFLSDYTEKYYHQVGDEDHDWWDMSAMVQESEFALSFGIKIANAPKMPRYKATDEFSAPDRKRMP